MLNFILQVASRRMQAWRNGLVRHPGKKWEMRGRMFAHIINSNIEGSEDDSKESKRVALN